jgi:hypothetical protein
MPYNTRRKSLSLPSLGIHLPNTSRAHRSPSASKGSSATEEPLPPSKKVKRSHDQESQLPKTTAPSPSTSGQGKGKGAVDGSRLRSARGALEHTPPPSPGDEGVVPKIDTEGINDDVVVAAIQQLEKTGNRPHLVRELAAVLTAVNETVAKLVYISLARWRSPLVLTVSHSSANPAALLSSRLSAYMKRSWTALSPCPIAKELIPVHPRKVFYYLTTCPAQPLPENLDDALIVDGKRITPSLSSASIDQDEEDGLVRERARLSPSPEVDLSSPEFGEDHADMDGRGSGSGSFSDHRQHRLLHNHRAASPPLEGDEREFTQTASSVRERASEEKASRKGSSGTPSLASFDGNNESNGPTGGFPASPMDEDPLSSTSENQQQYGDYFSQEGSRSQEQDLDEAAAVALFGTSPSPSLSSVSSSLSSGTRASSDAGSTTEGCDDATNGLLSLKQSIAESVRGATPVSVVEDCAPVSALKRTIDMAETGFSSKLDMEPKKLRAAFDFEMIIDSWSDLRSPETVEVDELDEMFGDI